MKAFVTYGISLLLAVSGFSQTPAAEQTRPVAPLSVATKAAVLPKDYDEMRIHANRLILICLSCGTFISAQDRVAEGEYRTSPVSPKAKIATRWVLYSKVPSGYHLVSEIQGMPNGRRFLQIEDLDNHFVPASLGYEAYTSDNSSPVAMAQCKFVNGMITCSGTPEKQGSSICQPYKYTGTFWLSIEGLFTLDLPWLLGGAANMAFSRGDTSIATIVTSANGEDGQCYFNTDEKEQLRFIESTFTEIDGKKVHAKHYSLGDGSKLTDLWIADSGIVIKMDDFVLANYIQFKEIIPEIKIEDHKLSHY